MYKHKIVDTVLGEETVVDLSAKEVKEIEAAIKKEQEIAKAEADRQAARQLLLDKLGISAEEAKLLLG